MKYFNAFQLLLYLSGAPLLVNWLVMHGADGLKLICIPLIVVYVFLAIYTITTVGDAL